MDMEMEERVELLLAVSRYLRSREVFRAASQGYTDCCKQLRDSLGQDKRYVCESDYKHYLVTSDKDGNFDVELIEVI